MAGSRVLRAVLPHRRQVHRERDRQGQQRRQRGAAVEREHHRARVRRGHAQRARRQRAGLHRLRVVQRIEQLAERRGRHRRERAAEAGHDLRGVERLAIAPAQAVAQHERPAAAVGRHRPALRHARHQPPARVLGDQPFVEVAQHVAAGDFLAAVRVERARLRAVAALQDLRRRGERRECQHHAGQPRQWRERSKALLGGHGWYQGGDYTAGLAIVGDAPHIAVLPPMRGARVRSQSRQGCCDPAARRRRARCAGRLPRLRRARRGRLEDRHRAREVRLPHRRPASADVRRRARHRGAAQGPDPVRLGSRWRRTAA